MRIFAQKPKATQMMESAKSKKSIRVLSGQSRDVRAILHLQRTIGNQAVQRLLKINAAENETGSTTAASPRFAHSFSRTPLLSPSPIRVQPKLTVNTPGDTYEQEADRVAGTDIGRGVWAY
jgi:hypothetical protein